MRRHIQHGHGRVARCTAIAGAALLTMALTIAGPPMQSLPAARGVIAVPDGPADPIAPEALEVSAEHQIEPPPDPATTMPRSAPVHLQIPAIDVDTGLMNLELRADGTLDVPPEGFPAGWFTGASAPGELGPAIIAGHVDWGGQPGVFFDLRYLNPGDEVIIERADGSTAIFAVTSVEHFSKDAFPTELVYGDIPTAGLRLITCGGGFDRQARSYLDNIVAFAELISFSAT